MCDVEEKWLDGEVRRWMTSKTTIEPVKKKQTAKPPTYYRSKKPTLRFQQHRGSQIPGPQGCQVDKMASSSISPQWQAIFHDAVGKGFVHSHKLKMAE